MWFPLERAREPVHTHTDSHWICISPLLSHSPTSYEARVSVRIYFYLPPPVILYFFSIRLLFPFLFKTCISFLFNKGNKSYCVVWCLNMQTCARDTRSWPEGKANVTLLFVRVCMWARYVQKPGKGVSSSRKQGGGTQNYLNKFSYVNYYFRLFLVEKKGRLFSDRMSRCSFVYCG